MGRNSRREEQKAMQDQAQSTATCNQQTTTKAPPSWARTIGDLPNALIGRVLSELPFVSDGTRGGLLAASCVSHAWNSRVTALFNEYHEHHCEAEKWRRGTATVYSISIPAPSYSDPQRTVCQRSLAFYTRVSVLHLHKLMSGSSLHDWAIVAAEAGDLNALNALLRHQSWTTERKEELLYTAAHCGRKQVARGLVQQWMIAHDTVRKQAVRRQKRVLHYAARMPEPEPARLAEEECSVCLDAKRTVQFMPCTHLACCNVCARKMFECPLCRRRIVSLRPGLDTDGGDSAHCRSMSDPRCEPPVQLVVC